MKFDRHALIGSIATIILMVLSLLVYLFSKETLYLVTLVVAIIATTSAIAFLLLLARREYKKQKNKK